MSKRLGLSFELHEECRCLQCDAALPREAIECKLTNSQSAFEGTRQIVRAYCEFCDILYTVPRVLSGGLFRCTGSVAIVTDGRERAAFIARVESLRGVRHVRSKAIAGPESAMDGEVVPNDRA